MVEYPSHCEALNELKPHEDKFGLPMDVPDKINLREVLPQSLINRFMLCKETNAFQCKNKDCPSWV